MVAELFAGCANRPLLGLAGGVVLSLCGTYMALIRVVSVSERFCGAFGVKIYIAWFGPSVRLDWL